MTWTTLKHETKVNVDNVTLLINHDIAIVSVLDLKEELHHTVGGHGGDEVPPRVLVGGRGLVPVLFKKIRMKISVSFSSQLVTRFCIRDTFDDSTSWLGCHNFIRE